MGEMKGEAENLSHKPSTSKPERLFPGELDHRHESLLLPRRGEQVHVALDVHVVGDGVDAPERVCDLPVEVSEQLLQVC